MKNFSRLSRAEMKNVTGGIVVMNCILVCERADWGFPGVTITANATPDCSEASKAACFNWYVKSCTCRIEGHID